MADGHLSEEDSAVFYSYVSGLLSDRTYFEQLAVQTNIRLTLTWP